MSIGGRRLRVAHIINTCFNRTETFLYDIVTATRQFESWCVTSRMLNLDEFPFSRIRLDWIQWESYRFWDLFDRALYKVIRGHDFPVRRAFFRIRPAIIHAHFAPEGYKALRYSRRYDIPLLTSFYGYDASSLPEREGWKERLAELFRDGTAFAVEGPAMKERLIGLGCRPEKIHILPLVLHADRYAFAPRSLSATEAMRILFVGRFVEKKGLPVLLKALASVRHQLSPFELTIIGAGEAEAEMRGLVSDLSLNDEVTFLGFQSRTTVIEQMDQSHILAVPSRTACNGDTEGGAPTILMEAQASGLPIVSTCHADIPFAVAPEYRTFLAEENNVDDFTRVLLAMRNASSKWAEIATSARDFVETLHGISDTDRIGALYKTVCQEYKSSSRRNVESLRECAVTT